MRKMIFQMMVTLDGYFEGPNRDISWHNVDQEFNEYATNFLNSLDVLLFGRVTYELMAGYWPTPLATTDDPIVAGKMNSLRKVVFSRTLKRAEWNNTRLIKTDAEGEVLKLKQQPGKDMAIFGSSDLAISLMKADLIDEFRIIVNPIVLGGGKPLLKGLDGKFSLALRESKPMRSGNVILCYEPKKT